MGRRLLTVIIVALLTLVMWASTALGEVSIGVKSGDWIEYHATTTGNPPEEHNVTWARLEVLQVQGSEIRINVTTQARNGSISSALMTLNIEKGQIGAWWIIPANLNPGDKFYDAFLGQEITIQSEGQREFAGAVRTVTNATVPARTKLWDKATGVFVVSADDLPDYTINVEAYSTNLWSPQQSGTDSTLLIAVVLVVVLAVAAVAAVLALAMARKKGKQQAVTSPPA
ncbi:MAG: hypothetical protein ACE14S_05840 [Candidatus Bathyarchaeia archaeon]